VEASDRWPFPRCVRGEPARDELRCFEYARDVESSVSGCGRLLASFVIGARASTHRGTRAFRTVPSSSTGRYASVDVPFQSRRTTCAGAQRISFRAIG
jgi:hypothetical protein